MRFQILHESRGRVRLRAVQRTMSMRDADLLEAWILALPGVDQVTVHERICGVTILFQGERAALYGALARFSYAEAGEEAVGARGGGRGAAEEGEDRERAERGVGGGVEEPVVGLDGLGEGFVDGFGGAEGEVEHEGQRGEERGAARGGRDAGGGGAVHGQLFRRVRTADRTRHPATGTTASHSAWFPGCLESDIEVMQKK